MRYPNDFPRVLAQELGSLTGVRLEPALRELSHAPTASRVRVTLARVQDLFCGPWPWRRPEVTSESVRVVASSLVELALASEPDCRDFPFASAGHAHFIGCPTCAKRLGVIYAVAVEDLRRVDLRPRRELYMSYRRALETMLPFVDIDCGGGVSVPVLAETDGQESAVVEAADRLWRVPEFLHRLDGAILSERVRAGRTLPDDGFRETVDGFVRGVVTLRFVGRVTGRA